MQRHYLDSELAGLAIEVPDVTDTALVLSKIADFCDELHPEEKLEMHSMAQIRQLAFASGRHCAHQAQHMLGLAQAPILRDKRVPLWPAASVGSITHSETVAGAVVSTSLRGVGLDIESSGRVEEKLFRVLFNEQEKEQIRNARFDAATVMFSAKEAGYKAIYPTGRKFIGFLEAQIILNPAAQTFTISYLGDHAPNRVLERGYGYWREHHGQILTLFMIE
ncbi:MAG: 4'-phosphopantetheinyl transferase [bacterium]